MQVDTGTRKVVKKQTSQPGYWRSKLASLFGIDVSSLVIPESVSAKLLYIDATGPLVNTDLVHTSLILPRRARYRIYSKKRVIEVLDTLLRFFCKMIEWIQVRETTELFDGPLWEDIRK